MFGRLARWRKERIGGTVWYLDCELAEGYAELAPAREPKALPRPGTMVRGTPTTHNTRIDQLLGRQQQLHLEPVAIG